MVQKANYQAVVIGVSAGGMEALPQVLSPLPGDFPAPVLVVQHMDPNSHQGFLAEFLDGRTQLRVREAVEREKVSPGHVYVAPANYHLLVEPDETLGLSVDEKVNHSRPSIDVLFESASIVYGKRLVGVILTGASSDGALGLKSIRKKGGLTVVQSPHTAHMEVMPASAIRVCGPDYVLPLAEIAKLLIERVVRPNHKSG